jgi:uncharacterized protein (DUF433 family)
MLPNPPIMTIPLQRDEHGTIRVSNTRVTLDTLISRYHQGDSPEEIHEGFPTVPITDIYAVIAYYLAYHNELDVYLQRQKEEAEHIRQKIEANLTPRQQAFNDRVRKLAEKKRRAKGE